MHDFSVNLFYTLSYPLYLCFTWSSIFVDSCIGTLLHQLRITAPFNTRAPQHWRRITGALFGMIGLKADLSLLYGRRCRRIPLLPSESHNAHKVVTVTERQQRVSSSASTERRICYRQSCGWTDVDLGSSKAFTNYNQL